MMSRVKYESIDGRVKATTKDVTIAASTAVKSMYEKDHAPVYYFPREDVRMDLMQPTDHHTR